MKVAEITFSLFLFLIALVMFIVGLSYPYESDYGPGPGFAPVWVSGILIICTVALTISSIKKYKDANFFSSKKGMWVLLIYIILLALTIILSNVLGLVISLVVFCFIIFRFIDLYDWKRSIMVAVGTGLVIYIIFDYWLKIPLPSGLFFS